MNERIVKMWNRVKRNAASLILGLAVGGTLCLMVLLLISNNYSDTAEPVSDPVPAPSAGALDLSIPDREYRGLPAYRADFYLAHRGAYYPAWVIEVDGNTYLVMHDGIRAYPLEGESWPQE